VLRATTSTCSRSLALLFTKESLNELVVHDLEDKSFALFLVKEATVTSRADMPEFFVDPADDKSRYREELEIDGKPVTKVSEINSFLRLYSSDYITTIVVYGNQKLHDCKYTVVIENAPVESLNDKKIHKYVGKKVTIKY
jgi:hypothetical protein